MMEEEKELEKVKGKMDEATCSVVTGAAEQSVRNQSLSQSYVSAQHMQGKQYMRQGRKSIFRSIRDLPATYRVMRSLGNGKLASLRDSIKMLYGVHRLTRGVANITKGMMVENGGVRAPSIDLSNLTQVTDPQNVEKSLMQTGSLLSQLRSLKDTQNQQCQQAQQNVAVAQAMRQDTRIQQTIQSGRAFVRSGVTATSGLIDVGKGRPVKAALKGGLAISDITEGVESTLKATLGRLSDLGATMEEERHLAFQNNAVHQTEYSIETVQQQQAVLEQILASKGR